jgi:hypothetical protein
LNAKYFATAQESQRKDVERAFSVLQARYQIVRQPARLWDEATLRDIMTTCIIMHNMILEDEQDLGHIESPYENSDCILRNVQTGRAQPDNLRTLYVS